MHDDQIRGLLRTLEDDREPDPTFAEALFPRLALLARGTAPNRSYLVLVAAALLVAMLGAAIAIGSGLVRLPQVLWSPSGTSILFGTSGSSAGVGADLWIVPADGSGAPSRLTPEELNASQADWQPVLVPLP